MNNDVILTVNNGTENIDMRMAFFTQFLKQGNAYLIRIPREIRKICELENGNYVRVEIEKIDTNLHVDNAARQDPEARNKGIHQDA